MIKDIEKTTGKIVGGATNFALIFTVGLYLLYNRGLIFPQIVDLVIGLVLMLLAIGLFLVSINDIAMKAEKIRKYWVRSVYLRAPSGSGIELCMHHLMSSISSPAPQFLNDCPPNGGLHQQSDAQNIWKITQQWG